jgi:hypothetical protein
MCLVSCASAAFAAPPAAELYTASDFPRLADGIIPGFSGQATVGVWSPGTEAWELKSEGSTITLTSSATKSDSAPRFQSLGTITLEAGKPLKVVVPPPPSSVEAKPEEEAKSGKDAPKPPPAPVPTLLLLSVDPKFDGRAALDLIRGRIDSTDPSPDLRRTAIRTNREGADFKPPADAQAWRDRAEHVREQLRVTLGLWPMFPKTPLNPEVHGKIARDGYTIEKVVLETFPGFTLSGNLYRPIGRTGKSPGILSPHGHHADGRVNVDVQQRCIRWAKLGAVIFMYDMVGYNDSKPFSHSFLNDRLRQWGMSLPMLQTWNSIRALDWLTSLPDVDSARIGCTGASGGGTQTFLLTALDDRVKVAAPVVMVSHAFQGGCLCENAAGLRIGTDNVEFAALAAPRPLKLVGATGDWTALTMSRAYPALQGVYSLISLKDHVSADVFDFKHNYNQTSRNAVYPFMAHWLLGIDDADSTREGEQFPEKPEDLLTFDAEHPAPTNRKTPEQLEEYLIGVRSEQIAKLAPADSSAAWQAARELLHTGLKVRVGIETPPPGEIEQKEVRRISRDGVTIIHSLVGRKKRGDAIPVVRLIPRNATGRVTVLSHPRGKAAIADATGRPEALTQSLLDRGQSVVAFDPLFVGEALPASSPVPHRTDTYVFDTYNPVSAVDQLQDLATVLAWARARPDVHEVHLVARELSGPQALLARPLLEGLGRTAIDLNGLHDGDGSSPLPPLLDVPGILQFGGLRAASALAAPFPLWLYRAGRDFDRRWPENAYRLGDVPDQLRIDETEAHPDALARWIDRGE